VVGIHKETLRGKDWDSDFMKGKTYEHLATFTLMLLGLCGNALSQAAEFSSYYSGNRYDFRLTHDQLLNTPVWLENAKTNRIHLFRHALPGSAAVSYLRTLFDDANSWRVNEIKLVPLNERWVYVVSFVAPMSRFCADCLTTPFGVVVTMDGNAVPAAVSPQRLPLSSINKSDDEVSAVAWR